MPVRSLLILCVLIYAPQCEAYVTVGNSSGSGICSHATIPAALASGNADIRVANTNPNSENLIMDRSVIIRGGFTSKGGGVYAGPDTTFSIAGNSSQPGLIMHNHATGDGGGIYAQGSATRVTLTNAYLGDNTSVGNGGGIALYDEFEMNFSIQF